MISPAALMLALDAKDPKFLQTLWLVGAALVVGSLVWSSFRRKRRNNPESRISQHAARHNERLDKQARQDMDELMVRLEEVSREICGQIDTRFAKLEHVIVEADRATAALEAAAKNAAAGGVVADGHGAAADNGLPLDPQHAEVCRRSRGGQDVIRIAREMNMQPGEVELILSLNRNYRPI